MATDKSLASKFSKNFSLRGPDPSHMDSPLEITFHSLHPKAVVPQRHSDGAAGYDLHCIEPGSIEPGSAVSVRTGFALRIPFNLLGVVLGRSGLSLRNGLCVQSTYAKNDQEIVVNLKNTSNIPFVYEERMRIAQIIFVKLADVDLVKRPTGEAEPGEDAADMSATM